MEAIKSFNTSSEQLEQLMEEMKSLDKESKAGGAELQKTASKAMKLLLELKRYSRRAHMGVDACRKDIVSAKESVDKQQLQLQNLLYEKAHLQRQIMLCRDFATPELDKMAKDEAATAEAGEAGAGRGEKGLGLGLLGDIDQLHDREVHQGHLDTLAAHIQERKELAQELAEVQAQVKVTASQGAARKQFLAQLPHHLQAILKASESLSKYMGGGAEGEGANKAPAGASVAEVRQLPRPLFVLYSQLHGYATHFAGMQKDGDKDFLQVEVVDAASYPLPPPSTGKGSSSKTPPPGSKRPRGEEDDESRSSRRSKSRRSSGNKAVVEDTPGGALGVHAKAVLLKVGVWVKETSRVEEANICFQSLDKLGVVTVVVKAGPVLSGSDKDKGAMDLASAARLLAGLFPEDMGVTLPTPASRQALLSIAPHIAGRSSSLSASRVGRSRQPPAPTGFGSPYRWAQWLAGLQPLQDDPDHHLDPMELEPSTRAVVERIRSRVRSRAVLCHLLGLLSSKPHPVPCHPALAEALKGAPSSSEITKWQEISVPANDPFAIRVAPQPGAPGGGATTTTTTSSSSSSRRRSRRGRRPCATRSSSWCWSRTLRPRRCSTTATGIVRTFLRKNHS
uniref:THO complex subunit 5 n=1 Tax=Fibrocapsa japonica TaxID=94617 RepID=A0A7S2Y031_9STRA